MVIILNTNCCGGNGLFKWNMIKDYILKPEVTTLNTNEKEFKILLNEYVNNGETKFIAAGGDGTINYLLNSLIAAATSEQLKSITFGAIGIGSSNDFHKPFNKTIAGIPISIDFQNADYRDVGVLTCTTSNVKIKKYFLINASIGITANANHLFNNPDQVLSCFKRFNTKFAILYAAIKTILTYKNLTANFTINGENFSTAITNLGITKSPHFSGDFCYDSVPNYVNRKFDIHLVQQMNKFEIIKLMHALTHNSFSKLNKIRSWQSDNFEISSDENFAFEYDGEVLTTDQVQFKVLHNLIKVCSNGKSI